MSKTLEIWHGGEENEGTYRVVSPDRDTPEDVQSFEVEGHKAITGMLHEDGRTSIDIPNDKYFHVEVECLETGGKHATISVKDEPSSQVVLYRNLATGPLDNVVEVTFRDAEPYAVEIDDERYVL